MGIDKGQLRDADVYVRYPFEDVMFRYDGQEKRAYRRFIGETPEAPVSHDNELLNLALSFGEEIDAATYHRGGL